MPNAKEIKDKIKIVKSTRKITKAMEMVAASKMRKAEERMRISRPYTSNIKAVISHLINARLEFEHPYLEERDTAATGIIVISSDRGLCGGLNFNLFKKTLPLLQRLQEENHTAKVCAIGKKSLQYFKENDSLQFVAQKNNCGDSPSIEDIIGPIKVVLDLFVAKKLDKVYLCYNKFVNTMQQDVQIEQLLPLDEENHDFKQRFSWDYIYEPCTAELLENLMKRYIEATVYQAMVENLACEQAARMVAMKSASDNASNLIDEFVLAYNKARQAAITKELAEIVGGAAAV